MVKRILIVDDDSDLVELLESALSSAGYATDWVNTGEDALRQARHVSPDLVLLDLMLPKMNGYNVCELLRSDPATAAVPIIMMTALPGAFPRLAGLEMGVEAYINKPFEVSELIARIEEVFSLPCGGSIALRARTRLALPDHVAFAHHSRSGVLAA